MANNNLTNIQVYRKKTNMNIGIVIFGVVFIYLVVTVLMYLTDKHISAYEVRQGSILKDTAYTGFIVRSETVVASENDGYVNYFVTEGSKVGAKTRVYTLSSDELNFEDNNSEDTKELTSEEQAALLIKTQSFSENYSESQYDDVYTLKDSIVNVLESKSSQSRQSQLDVMLSSGGDGLQVFNAARDGVISYSIDGYEGIAVTDVTEDMVDKKDYHTSELKNNDKVKAGSPAYKLITEDSWTIVISIDETAAQSMADMKRVKVRFSKDNETTTAGLEIQNKADSHLAYLSFSNAMIRYSKDRYIDLELILEDESGLKIPKSSVVKKDFYIVPEEYLTQGGNSKETGVLINKGDGNAAFKQVNVYSRDSKKGIVYLDPNAFEKDETSLIKPESADTYRLNKTEKMKGVYNINKGYSVFRQIKILSESDEYYIVESGNDYGLANYDHIALDGSTVRENDVVF